MLHGFCRVTAVSLRSRSHVAWTKTPVHTACCLGKQQVASCPTRWGISLETRWNTPLACGVPLGRAGPECFEGRGHCPCV